jgi:hypothetical protein
MAMEPTAEQHAAREVFAAGQDLALVAGAGTGKTSTLALMGPRPGAGGCTWRSTGPSPTTRRQARLVAVMYKLAIAIWHVLHDHVPTANSAPTTSQSETHRMTREANSLGLTIRFDPIEAA